MTPPFVRSLSTVVTILSIVSSSTGRDVGSSPSAPVIAAPGESGLRQALARAAAGDIVVLSTSVELHQSVRIEKSVTLRYGGSLPWDNRIGGLFNGTLFILAAPDIRLEGLELWGSEQTDGLTWEAEGTMTLTRCSLGHFRAPTAGEAWGGPRSTLRLDRVTAFNNHRDVSAIRLEATNCVFFGSRGVGASAYSAFITGCQFESNQGDGLIVTFGTVRDSVFRHNAAFGLRFDPDPGVLNLSGCLFYANAGGGLLLREEARATVDNCTFTRHTGPPAVVVSEASKILFRHCTVTDNLVIGGGEPGLWPSYPKGGAFALMSGAVELQNCLVADNPGEGDPHASGLIGEWKDGGGNVIGGPANLILVTTSEPRRPFELVPAPESRARNGGRLSDLVRDARGLSRLAGVFPDAGAIEAEADAVSDQDADGIPDSWELFRRMDPADAGDASSDADGDGSHALGEYLAGTDPTDPMSVQRIESIESWPNPLGEGMPYLQLSWTDVPGTDYRVQISHDLVTWRDAPGYYWPSWSFQTPADSPGAFYRVAGSR